MLRKVLLVILCINSLYSLLGLPELSCTVRLTGVNWYMIESDCFFYSALNQYLQNKRLITNVYCCYCRNVQLHNQKKKKITFILQKVTQPLVGVRKKSLQYAAKYLWSETNCFLFFCYSTGEWCQRNLFSCRLQIHKTNPRSSRWKYKHTEKRGLLEQQGWGTRPGCFLYRRRTLEENRRLFWPRKHKFDQPLEQRAR